MTELEASVRCLEAALAQARAENVHGNVDRVVELHKKFYTLVSEAPGEAKAIPPAGPEPSPDPRPKMQADKSPDIFRVTPKR
jgi:hypothetical protein